MLRRRLYVVERLRQGRHSRHLHGCRRQSGDARAAADWRSADARRYAWADASVFSNDSADAAADATADSKPFISADAAADAIADTSDDAISGTSDAIDYRGTSGTSGSGHAGAVAANDSPYNHAGAVAAANNSPCPYAIPHALTAAPDTPADAFPHALNAASHASADAFPHTFPHT